MCFKFLRGFDRALHEGFTFKFKAIVLLGNLLKILENIQETRYRQVLPIG